MNPEIEKLIDFALADGQITEKERNVILKKATELGFDIDELEIILDGKLHQIQAAQTKPTKEKFGTIKTCPACGASIKSMSLSCNDCGIDFSNSAANNTIQKLEAKIEFERDSYKRRKISKGDSEFIAGIDFDKNELPRIIKNYPIPNTKEDLMEVLSFMSSKVISSTDTENEEINAYHAKALEIIIKLQLMPNIDSSVLEKLSKIKNNMKKVKSKNAISLWITILLALAVVYFFYSFIAKLFGYHFWPF